PFPTRRSSDLKRVSTRATLTPPPPGSVVGREQRSLRSGTTWSTCELISRVGLIVSVRTSAMSGFLPPGNLRRCAGRAIDRLPCIVPGARRIDAHGESLTRGRSRSTGSSFVCALCPAGLWVGTHATLAQDER